MEVRETVNSTSSVLREMAAKGAPEGLVIVAEEQTAGKGRLGRSFYSPRGHGVYFSILLRPGVKAEDTTLITSAAAVAAARAIESVFGVHVGIKWVNDLMLNGKKVCGILTEATFGAGSSVAESAILGIGINISTPAAGFPGELAGVAAALTDRAGGGGAGRCLVDGDAAADGADGWCSAVEDADGGDADGGDTVAGDAVAGPGGERCRLIASVLDEFWRFYKNLPAREFLAEYRARSIVLGKEVYVVSGDARKPARALAIDDDCRLVVRYYNGLARGEPDGMTAALDSGEVSVRGIES